MHIQPRTFGNTRLHKKPVITVEHTEENDENLDKSTKRDNVTRISDPEKVDTNHSMDSIDTVSNSSDGNEVERRENAEKTGTRDS